jgi:hypothetical protein
MKGTVFVALNDYVERQYGIAEWNGLLAEVAPASNGIYTSLLNYDDKEFCDLLRALCVRVSVSSEYFLRDFGIFLFDVLNRKYPIFTDIQAGLMDFLAAVEGVVHVEVKKLFPEAYLPSLKVIRRTSNQMVLEYQSRRNMCFLAEGLIQGAAQFYGETVSITQSRCCHKGAASCWIDVSAVEGQQP